jgi:hypothetical protein
MNRVSVLIATIVVLPTFCRSEPVCASCHPNETRRFLTSAMGASLGPPSRVEGGRVTHQRSGSSIAIESLAGDRMVHHLSAQGLTASYEVAYQIGAGKLAHSYIVELKGYLFESPATWFRSYGWDMSPGYSAAPAIDFDRPITETCLYCHAGNALFSGADGRKITSTSLTAITCDRCHGDSEKHVREPSANNIVNPAKLPRRARDSVCEQCHLEGEARILNPGRSWRDFRPGGNLEQTAAVYVFQQNGREIGPVSQVEQLAESRCAVKSGGALWCGTCHSVHSGLSDRRREISQICLSCHSALSKAAHPDSGSGCMGCHMPQVSTHSAHVAVTDHRIRRRAEMQPAGNRTTEAEASGRALVAWIEPPPEARQRDLALAHVSVGLKRGILSLKRSGLDLLRALPASQRARDTEILIASCQTLLDQRVLQDAVRMCGEAAKRSPESADRAMNLGEALAMSGQLDAAESALNRAIALDPSLKHAYIDLWSLYDRRHRTRELTETSNRFLTWNPQNIMFRVLKAAIAAESAPSQAH